MTYRCHDCGHEFDPESADDGMYRFERCPVCGSARTTLTEQSDDRA